MSTGRKEIHLQIQKLKGDKNHIFKGTKIDRFLNWMRESMIEESKQYGKTSDKEWLRMCDELFDKATYHLFKR